MSTQFAVQHRREAEGLASITYRVCKSREFDGSLSVTVDTTKLLRVRRAIVQSGCEPVGIVKAVPLAGGTRVRMLIAMPHEHLDRVMRAIVQAIETDVDPPVKTAPPPRGATRRAA